MINLNYLNRIKKQRAKTIFFQIFLSIKMRKLN